MEKTKNPVMDRSYKKSIMPKKPPFFTPVHHLPSLAYQTIDNFENQLNEIKNELKVDRKEKQLKKLHVKSPFHKEPLSSGNH